MDGYVHGGRLCGYCTKMQWAERAVAKRVLRRMLVTGRARCDTQGNPLRVYESCDGQGFHIGHTRARARPNLNDPRLHWAT